MLLKNQTLYVVVGIHIQNPRFKLTRIDNDRARIFRVLNM